MRNRLAVLFLLLLVAGCSRSPSDVYGGATAGGATPGGVYGEGVGEPRTTTSNLDPLNDASGAGAGELVNGAVPGTQQDFEINVGDRVYFGYDSTSLDDAARGTLERQATWLQQYPNLTVTIEGHTDERGTNDYNLALGERRAAAIKNYLTALGAVPDQMLTISYGEERPVDPAHNDVAYAQNRRGVTVVNVVN